MSEDFEIEFKASAIRRGWRLSLTGELAKKPIFTQQITCVLHDTAKQPPGALPRGEELKWHCQRIIMMALDRFQQVALKRGQASYRLNMLTREKQTGLWFRLQIRVARTFEVDQDTLYGLSHLREALDLWCPALRPLRGPAEGVTVRRIDQDAILSAAVKSWQDDKVELPAERVVFFIDESGDTGTRLQDGKVTGSPWFIMFAVGFAWKDLGNVDAALKKLADRFKLGELKGSMIAGWSKDSRRREYGNALKSILETYGKMAFAIAHNKLGHFRRVYKLNAQLRYENPGHREDVETAWEEFQEKGIWDLISQSANFMAAQTTAFAKQTGTVATVNFDKMNSHAKNQALQAGYEPIAAAMKSKRISFELVKSKEVPGIWLADYCAYHLHQLMDGKPSRSDAFEALLPKQSSLGAEGSGLVCVIDEHGHHRQVDLKTMKAVLTLPID